MCTYLIWALLLLGVNLVTGLVFIAISCYFAFNPKVQRWIMKRTMESLTDTDESF